MGIFRFIFDRKPRHTPIVRINRQVLLGGQLYSIKIEPSTRNCCKVVGSVLHFGLKEMSRENFELYYEGWFRREARKAFKLSVAHYLEIMERMGYSVAEPRVKIYRMRRAWGRCYYTKGVVTLNYYLAMAPRECVDYIVLHELCHFLIHSHSAEFYGIMTRIDSTWRSSEQRLKEFARRHKLIR